MKSLTLHKIFKISLAVTAIAAIGAACVHLKHCLCDCTSEEAPPSEPPENPAAPSSEEQL